MARQSAGSDNALENGRECEAIAGRGGGVQRSVGWAIDGGHAQTACDGWQNGGDSAGWEVIPAGGRDSLGQWW